MSARLREFRPTVRFVRATPAKAATATAHWLIWRWARAALPGLVVLIAMGGLAACTRADGTGGPASQGSAQQECVDGASDCDGHFLLLCHEGAWRVVDCTPRACSHADGRFDCVGAEPCDDGVTRCQGTRLDTCTAGGWTAVECGTAGCGPSAADVSTMVCSDAAAGDPGGPGQPGSSGDPDTPTPPGDPGDPGESGGPTQPGAAVGELEACAAVGAICGEGLVCSERRHVCVFPCGDGLPACGDGRYCDASRAGSARAGQAGRGECLVVGAQRDGLCFDNGLLCADDNAECAQIDARRHACKVGCAFANFGGGEDMGAAGACPADESCLESPTLVEPQPGIVACTVGAGPGNCDGTGGFRCVALADGRAVCARPIGWCGAPMPMLGQHTMSAATAHLAAGYGCDMLTGHRGCTVTGASAAAATAECIAVNDAGASVCLGFCEAPGGNDLDCGAGFVCRRPAPGEAFFYEFQAGATTAARVACTGATDAACDGAAGYACIGPFSDTRAYHCARTAKVCVAAG